VLPPGHAPLPDAVKKRRWINITVRRWGGRNGAVVAALEAILDAAQLPGITAHVHNMYICVCA
jgi:hypothetical protein